MKYFGTTILLFFIFINSFSQTWKALDKQIIELTDKREFGKAILIAEKAVQAAAKEVGKNNTGYAGSLINLADLYERTGQYQKAVTLYIQAIEIDKKVLGVNHADYATDLNDLAQLYETMGQYEKAESLFVQAMGIHKKTWGENHPGYAKDLNDLASLYESMAQYEKAETLYWQSIKIIKKNFGETSADYAANLTNLGLLYTNMGQYEKAEPLLLQSVEIDKKVLGVNSADYATNLNNLALLYINMGQYEKAEPLFIRAMNIRKKELGEENTVYALSQNNLAGLYKTMGEYEKAEPLYLQALKIQKKILGEEHPDYANSLNNLAGLYNDLGEYELAEPLYIQAKDIVKKILGEDHPDYALSLNNLARCYVYMGQYEKAEPLYILAKEIRKKKLGETHPHYANSLMHITELYISMGQYEKAEPLILQSNQIDVRTLKNTFTILSENEKGNYLENNVVITEMNNSFIYYYPKASSAFIRNNFDQLLFFKSLTLADTKNVLASIRKSPDMAVQKLLADWENSKNILTKQYSLPVTNRRSDLKQIETRAEDLEKELNRKSSAFSNQQKAISISMKDIREGLQPDEAAIEFVSFDLYNKDWTDSTIYAAYILHKNDTVPLFVPLFEEKQLQQLLNRADTTALKSDVDKDEKEIVRVDSFYSGNELYNLVWQPLEPYLNGIKKISYSPAGKLYGIAFHALRADSTTLLMDKYQLLQYTSTRQMALRSAESQITTPTGISLFGNASFTMDSLQLVSKKIKLPGKEKVSNTVFSMQKRGSENNSWVNLPGTAEEIKSINQLFELNKIKTKLFVQAAASEENLKALNGNSLPYLHIATHGFFLPEPGEKKKTQGPEQDNVYTTADDPLMRSGLILAGANYAWSGKRPVGGMEDGIVTAYEISQLDLSKTELVVLSACQSALGDIKGSEGVFGLQRAFKIAGVKKLIVSLWKVPDKETAQLMTGFYGYLVKGKGIDESFRLAQADMRKKNEDDIYYWAAFVLVE